MIPVFFNGYGEWFIENSQGQEYPHSDLVCYIEYDSYNRRWQRIYPHNNAIGLFMLSDEDEMLYKEKELKHKKLNQKFDEFNLNFVNTLWLLPSRIKALDVVDPPSTEIEGNGRYYFKIRKYENSVPNVKDRIDNTLHPVFDLADQLEFNNSTNAETTASNQNKKNNALDPRAETTYLHTIAALYDFIAGEFPGVEKHHGFVNKSQLIKEIDDLYDGYDGLKERTLFNTLGQAIRKLKGR